MQPLAAKTGTPKGRFAALRRDDPSGAIALGPWQPAEANIRWWNGPSVEWSKGMRSVLALGLLIAWGASAEAATVRRSKTPERHVRPGQRLTVPQTFAPRDYAPKSYAVPGWTEEQTRSWLDEATGPKD
jgi:hypothetical protein